MSVPPVRIAPPPPGWTGGGAQRHRTPSRRQQRIRSADRPTAAMVLGIVSLVANILLLPSLIGILYGSRSLRAGTQHRGQAIAGIVCGSIGGAWSLVQLALVLLSVLLGPSLTGDRIADSITASAARSGTALSEVVCPDPVSTAAGATLTCTAGSSQVGPVSIAVTFTDSSGGFDWRVARSA